MQKYSAVEGSQIPRKKANQYGRRLEELNSEKGFITPAIVLEDAKQKSSPLHDWFEWNNDKAAVKWRLEQAQLLIRGINVEITNQGKTTQIRAFFSIKPTNELDSDTKKVYVSLESMQSDDRKRDQVIAYAKRELILWSDRYAQYSELKPITKFIKAHIKVKK